MAFYSIFIPNQDAENDDKSYVFTEKDEALKVLKNNRDGRLKCFKNNEEAVIYAQSGCEDMVTKFPDLKSPSATAEKASFHVPGKHERIQFRKAIEEGNFEEVKLTIWGNPRYLVNVGDTPTSLKDGCRYNALHICAIHKRPNVAELILQTISNIKFVELLHGKKNTKICQEVCDILLDYYLNMPEKGRSETPLHLAVKYGAIEVVEVLTRYPQCKMTINSENYLPKDIICSRINDAPAELKDKIAKLLEERFYVPVIRSIDGTVPPSIGKPFSPSNPPEINMDPLSPEVEIQAYAGPMSKDQAETFRRRWKTPPRTKPNDSPNKMFNYSPKYRNGSPQKSINNNTAKTPVKYIINHSNTEDSKNGNIYHSKSSSSIDDVLKASNDCDNNNGNSQSSLPNLVTESSKPVHFALTPLLKNSLKRDLFFTYREQMSSPVTLNDLNMSFASDSSDFISNTLTDSPLALKELHVKIMDTEKGLETIGRGLAKEQKVGWKEYWDFLEGFIDIASPDGLEKLENYLQSQKEKEETHSKKNKEELLLSNLCNALDKLEILKERNNLDPIMQSNSIWNKNNSINSKASVDSRNNPQTTAPYLCVEKSLQVFAKRCTKTILQNIESVVSINDAFLSELKRLKSLICSFKDDVRFFYVDFSYVHSRFSNLIASYLKNSQDIDNNQLFKIQQCFQQIIKSRSKVIDKGLINSNLILDKKEHLQCVSELILKYLIDQEQKIPPESLKTEAICSDVWSNENRCKCLWDATLSRQSNRKKRYEFNDVSRRLFDVNDDSIEQCKSKKESETIDINTWRKSNNESNSDLSDVDNSDDDVFFSDFGSDDEDNLNNFYTPPESPSMLDIDLSDLDDYHIYLLGKEPTKRDLDVLNAIFYVDIDKEKYPNIYRWRAAVLNHPNDERNSFPSPSVVVKKRSVIQDEEESLIEQNLFPMLLQSSKQSPLLFRHNRRKGDASFKEF